MSYNIYRAARKAAAENEPRLASCESAQSLVNIERTRLLAIEKDQKLPNPEDVLRMAEVYGAPELRNHYCSTQCPLGEGMPRLISGYPVKIVAYKPRHTLAEAYKRRS